MTERRLEAVLLDMGGVLIPEVKGFEGAADRPDLIAELRRLGVEHPRSLVLETGARVRTAYRDRARDHSQPDPEVVLGELEPRVRSLLIQAFAAEETLAPYPHARPVVEALASRYRLGLVSNTIMPGDHHARALEEAGILRDFEVAIWSANFGTRKPARAIIDHVLDRLGVAPEHAVFVGDKVRTDVLAAQNAGLRSVWLRSGDAPDTGEAVPDFVIDDLRELPALLERALDGRTRA